MRDDDARQRVRVEDHRWARRCRSWSRYVPASTAAISASMSGPYRRPHRAAAARQQEIAARATWIAPRDRYALATEPPGAFFSGE
jgi:hypothetical protein